MSRVVIGLLFVSSYLAAAPFSDVERREIQARLARFYATPADPAVMNLVPPKYSLSEEKFVHPNRYLLMPATPESHPLLHAAQRKGSADFQKRYCDHVLRNAFPELECEKADGTRATIEGNDTVSRLAGTWIAPAQLATALSAIPSSGESLVPLWSDDYWRTKYGQTSYRYSERKFYGSYEEAVASYSQPFDWEGMHGFDLSTIASRVISWSPAEKYDLSLGDEGFGLTQQQKTEGSRVRTPSGTVEEWMGLCHGWAGASVMIPPPVHPAKLVGPRGIEVTWYPADVKALLTLQWGNGNSYNNFVGGRCNVKKPETYPNGRIIQQECFDTNPATLHMALGNMIGKARLTFNMDATYDYEVWNQPIKSYQFTYFRPGSPSMTSTRWEDVAIAYDEDFKENDRFQSPPTRGLRIQGGGYDDRGIKKIVGVMATVVYLVEFSPPNWQPTPQANNEQRVTYTYDLELYNENGAWVPKGGEWHQNTHPDFLWIPKKDTYPRTKFDYVDIGFTGDEIPTALQAQTARDSSQIGFPLCRSLKTLVSKTADRDGVRCPTPSK